MKHLPLINFVIATSALTFQVMVLYPWHHQLSSEFSHVKKMIVDKHKNTKHE